MEKIKEGWRGELHREKEREKVERQERASQAIQTE